LLAMAVTTADARAQDLWQWDIEAGGSVFFGEVDQTAFTAGASVEKADSAFELSASLRFDYGETKDQETGASV
ncbi:MAG: hypothetical protein GWO27_01450, partial [Thermoplasmata archaeon]|nr:hypothetical protein [Thermoplasmata archaeon]